MSNILIEPNVFQFDEWFQIIPNIEFITEFVPCCLQYLDLSKNSPTNDCLICNLLCWVFWILMIGFTTNKITKNVSKSKSITGLVGYCVKRFESWKHILQMSKISEIIQKHQIMDWICNLICLVFSFCYSYFTIEKTSNQVSKTKIYHWIHSSKIRKSHLQFYR